jgi:hypothetical protein
MTPMLIDPDSGSLSRRAASTRSSASAVALEQAHAQRPLELRQLRAERRLRHAALLGRAPEAARVSDGDGVLKLAQRRRMGCERHGGPDRQKL